MSGKSSGETIAVFDVGTNTVLYVLMAREPGGEPVVVEEDLAVTRLGAGLGRGEGSPPAGARTVEALASFVERARRRGAAELKVVGTEALRRGPGRKDFVSAVATRLGLAVEVLSPEEEGRLALRAARRSLPPAPGPLTVVDVGGGSAQIASDAGDGAAPPRVESFAVGCVLVTEKYLTGEPRAEAWEAARDYVAAELAAVGPARGRVVITGGTATTAVTLELALPSYDPARVHGHVLEAARIASWAERVYFLPPEARRGLGGMPADRAEVFAAGALALVEILRGLGSPRATVCARGIRFGVAYRYFEEKL